MSKLDTVALTKLANGRLKIVGDTCLAIAEGRSRRHPERERKLIAARLDRELTADDSGATTLRDAVETFWRELGNDADSDRQFELAQEVYIQVRQVQQDRWRRIEAKHGKISHFFDSFGQIKPQYRRPKPSESLPVIPWRRLWWIAAAMLLGYWYWG